MLVTDFITISGFYELLPVYFISTMHKHRFRVIETKIGEQVSINVELVFAAAGASCLQMQNL